MCPGTATKLLCPHYLIHWAGPRCPRNCALPARRAFLPCTCAPCDPAFRRARLAAAHAAERAVLAAQIRAAMIACAAGATANADDDGGAGGGVTVRAPRPPPQQQQQLARALERRLHALMAAQRAGAAASMMIRAPPRGLDPAVGCRWPGMYEQWVAENLGRPVDWDRLLNG